MGFEPTTSGPDLLGVTSAPGSPSITGLWYPLGGVNPLDQARRRPPLLRLNPQVFYLSVGKKNYGLDCIDGRLASLLGEELRKLEGMLQILILFHQRAMFVDSCKTVSSTGYPSRFHPCIPSSISFTRKPKAVNRIAALVDALQ